MHFLGIFAITNLVAIKVDQTCRVGIPILVLIFLIRILLQWAIHRMYHHVGWMWEFHKVHS